MDETSATGRILTVLKRELKAKGLRYTDVAARLGVSEVTVKRYLTGKGVDVPALETLAEIVDLDLLTLVGMAEQQRASTPVINKTQQTALAKSLPLAAVYFGLLRGWMPSQIGNEFNIPPQKLEGFLAKLSALGLIRRTSNHGYRILAKPDADKKGGGFLAELSATSAHKFMSEIDLRDEKCEWFYNAVHLSPHAAKRLRELIKAFTADMRTIIKNEGSFPSPEGQWYRIFIAAEPISRKKLYADDGVMTGTT